MEENIDDELKKLMQEMEINFGFKTAQDFIQYAAQLLSNRNAFRSPTAVSKAVQTMFQRFPLLKDHPEYQGLVEQAAAMETYLCKGVLLLREFEEHRLGRSLTIREWNAAICRALEGNADDPRNTFR